jgi:flagellar motor component MotA
MGQKTNFYQAISRRALTINETAAGAGLSGLIGFIILGILSSVFFITENYFISLGTISIGLLLYVSGNEFSKMCVSAFTLFFSSKHLVARAAYMQDTLSALDSVLKIRRSQAKDFVGQPIQINAVITLPNNPLSEDIQRLLENGKDEEYAEYLAHSYYVGCHELYEFSNDNFDFVSNVMPLFGLIGTIVGLISMFDTLGADVTVEALSPQLALALKTTLYGAIFSSVYRIIGVRFGQRLTSLDYDYDAFLRALKTLIKNKAVIEVE